MCVGRLHIAKKFIALSLILFQAPAVLAAAGKVCSVVFAEDSRTAADRMIHNLAEMRMNLDIAKAEGADTVVMTALIADYNTKESELIRRVDAEKIMTRAELLENVRQQIVILQNARRVDIENADRRKKEEEQRRKDQEQKINEYTINGDRAIFHRIEAGAFKIGKARRQQDATIDKDFEMMATPTTQIIWKTVVDLAKAKLSGYENLKSDPSEVKKGRHPVTNISYLEVKQWFKALNELSDRGEPLLNQIILEHKKGDIYHLQTYTEWEYVVRGRGQYDEFYFFGKDPSQLENYAWFAANSGGTTHPVALKQPLIVDGKEFYDMYGNVMEMVDGDPRTSDSWGGKMMTLRSGGHSTYRLDELTSHSKLVKEVNWSGNDAGFRMVREVRD